MAAALVVLIDALMSQWVRQFAPEKPLLGFGAIVTLVAVCIVTARYSAETVGDVY